MRNAYALLYREKWVFLRLRLGESNAIFGSLSVAEKRLVTLKSVEGSRGSSSKWLIPSDKHTRHRRASVLTDFVDPPSRVSCLCVLLSLVLLRDIRLPLLEMITVKRLTAAVDRNRVTFFKGSKNLSSHCTGAEIVGVLRTNAAQRQRDRVVWG